ncbi:hypothetical protein EPJ69_11790 [Brachyspira aalborgi]|uniref:Uncharacterized protein n=1 Tax=Brachyspira aalborgi TaxID=29522 RepID=A0A5C8DX13_9SPIR|nr:hypothetical protein [Brachyspira aalborgi]TXJ30239.1 hypothetical protein EPJ69_11790 [Brachyspira aalborgi]
MHSATQLNSTQLNSNLNSFKIFASFFDVLKNLLPCISLNARNYLNYAFSYAFNFEIISRDKNLKSNYGEKFAYTLKIKKEGNSKYAILSYGDEVKAKLTGEANKSKYAKGYKFVLSHSKNVIRLKYKFNTSDKSKYVSYDKYGIFEQGKVVNSLLFKIIN